MRRRDFIRGIAYSATAWPLTATAQQATNPVIGFLSIGSPPFDAARLAAFRLGLSETGYVEGRNLAAEYRWAEGHNDQLPALAAELVRRPVALIAAIGGPAPALAAKAATTTIPIVFTIPGDPVRQGLVESLNRPSGNLTGISNLAGVVVAKQLEVLHQTVPKAALIGLLVNPTNPTVDFYTKDTVAAAEAIGQKLLVAKAASETDLEAAFAMLAEQHAEALLVPSDALFNSIPNEIVALAARHALPAIYAYSEFARAGGLMSYGVSFGDPFRQTGIYAGRILNGEKPADLPVMQGTKVELIINLKTAKTLGITMPLPLLGRADDVIE
jgi:putative tryptophan/tyrosine transport system substrate-binding protein